MPKICEPTEYAQETLYYLARARKLRESGVTFGKPLKNSVRRAVDDDLMCKIPIYDTDKRLYAGFNKVLHILMYGRNSQFYPDALGPFNKSQLGEGHEKNWSLPVWLYVFIIHRVTGSGINYNKNPSGFHNSALTKFNDCTTGKEVRQTLKALIAANEKLFTSNGYQIQQFKLTKPGRYALGGHEYLMEHAHVLAVKLADYIEAQNRTFTNVIDFCNKFNRSIDLNRFTFAYAALAADIADFYPNKMVLDSYFPAGTKAFACLQWQFKKLRSCSKDAFVEEAIGWLSDKTGLLPYDVEDCGACDVMRYLENYVAHSPGNDYEHVDRDAIFNNPAVVKNHPHGRQKAMLDHGLVFTFNDHRVKARGAAVLKDNGLSIRQYHKLIKRRAE